MIEVECETRKFGRSIGIIIPKWLAKKEGLGADEKVTVRIVKKANIKNVFGTLKTNLSVDEMNELTNEGED